MNGNHLLRGSIFKFVLAAAFVCLLPNVISAYTIVMRDGRRLQIPDDFVVDRATLTYRVSETIQVTLQMSAIDVVATEKVNGEAPGTLWRHRAAPTNTPSTPNTKKAGGTARSITNLDLESYRRVRIESERNYEKRRVELGLPRVEDQRQALNAVGERASEEARNIRSRDREAEEFWRNRADGLRNEISATNARIEYINRRLNELPDGYYGAFGNGLPFATVDQLSIGSPFIAGTIGTQTIVGSQFRRGFGFNNGYRRGFGWNGPNRRFGHNPFFSPFSPFGTIASVPYQNYDVNYERSTLIAELDQLMLQKVSLQSHWRDLEEEARKAGAYPGWLRPR